MSHSERRERRLARFAEIGARHGRLQAQADRRAGMGGPSGAHERALGAFLAVVRPERDAFIVAYVDAMADAWAAGR